MTLPTDTDTSGNWAIIGNRETVTYYKKLRDGEFDDPLTVTDAKRGPVSKELMMADAQLAKVGVRWTVWRAKMSGVQPKVGDRLVDADGYGYVVMNVELLSLRQRYGLTCTREPTVRS